MNAALILVGCGKMGSALLSGWLDRGLDADALTVVEPSSATAAEMQSRYGVHVVNRPDQINRRVHPDVVVFAVKPQSMDSVVPEYRHLTDAGSVVLSIAAGRTIASLQRMLSFGAAIVRAMPNTPAAVRKGITVACPSTEVTVMQRDLCTELLEAVGEVVWVNDERLLDAVTAVSGSGPAYVFLLAECLAAAAIDAGLPEDLAKKLARATIVGAGALLDGSGESPAALRRNVASPGGTTEAALKVLMADDGLKPLLSSAVRTATERSRELAR